jgi:hypothetical protein
VALLPWPSLKYVSTGGDSQALMLFLGPLILGPITRGSRCCLDPLVAGPRPIAFRSLHV